MSPEHTNPTSDAQPGGLEARNRELEAYAHTVAHSLKDPLSVIIATSDAIFHITDLTQEELRAYLSQIRTTAHRMGGMIDNLLLLSEVGNGDVPVAAVDMAAVVANALLRLDYLIRDHRAEITLPESWPTAMGYGPWIEEVWANFISNAIKHGGRPPSVELGGQLRPDGTVMFWVRDNGRGLSTEAQGRLFRAYGQFGSARTPGHGVGLSIVRRIIERLGGQVGSESVVGRGSLFFFTLPAGK